MSTTPEVRSSKILFDGASAMIITSGRLTNAASAQFGIVYVAPCDLYIHSISYYTDTEFTHASSALTLGTLADSDAYIDAVLLDTQVPGAYEVDMASDSVVLRRIPKGTAFAFGLDAADTTGKLTATAVLVPYDPD